MLIGAGNNISDLPISNSLAYCELHLVVAALFRPGGPDFDLYETDEDDVKPVHDVIVPLPRLGSKGVRFIFH